MPPIVTSAEIDRPAAEVFAYATNPALKQKMEADAAGASAADALIDVGGASPLAGALLDRGFRDLTVLDVSTAGMQHARSGTSWPVSPPGLSQRRPR